MKKYLVICICIILISFTVALNAQQMPAESSNNIPSAKSNNNVSIYDVSNPRIVEEGPYFQLLEGDNHTFYYYIYDEDTKVVAEGGGRWKLPEISMVNDNLVKFRTQAGTAKSTSLTFYYDAKKDEFSRTFHSVYDETDELIVYSCRDKLIVRNIFDRTAYYREITEFPHELTDAVEPFLEAHFVNGNKQIAVKYLTEESLTWTTDFVDLPE